MLWDYSFGQVFHLNVHFRFTPSRNQRGFYRSSLDSENVDFIYIVEKLEISSASEEVICEIDHVMQKLAISCLEEEQVQNTDHSQLAMVWL